MRPVQMLDERGASSVEYGLIVSTIACVVVAVVVGLGSVVDESFTDSCRVLASKMSSSAC